MRAAASYVANEGGRGTDDYDRKVTDIRYLTQVINKEHVQFLVLEHIIYAVSKSMKAFL